MTPNDEDEGEDDEEDGSESKDLKPRRKKVRQPSEREKTKEHVNMVFIGHVGESGGGFPTFAHLDEGRSSLVAYLNFSPTLRPQTFLAIRTLKEN